MGTIERDLTKGDVLRQLVKYAIPIVAASLLQALYSMVDMIIAGRFIGNVGISGINNASQIIDLNTKIAMGMTLGGNILISQCFGSKDVKRRKRATGTLLALSALMGVLMALVMFFGGDSILRALGAPAFHEASRYLHITALGLPVIWGYNALSAMLTAMGNSKKPLHFIAVSTITNVILDLLFVGYFKMGTGGAALATVISQTISFALALIYVLSNNEVFSISLKNFRIYARELITIVKLGVPCAIQMTVAAISWLTVTYMINKYGVDISAGNGISIKIKDFCQLFVTAMASGATTMIAQNIGAKQYDRAKQIMYTTMKITVALSLITIAVVELFAPQLAGIFNNEPAVIEAAVTNLRIEIIGQLFYALFLVYHALMAGAGQTMYVLASSFLNCILVRAVLTILLERYMGINGVYLACMIAPSASVPFGFIYTRSNIWQRSLDNVKA